jgi:GntR family transcriptional regulator, rspAB operon transcriptional repressor
VKQWMLVRRALESEIVAACARELWNTSIERLRQNLAYQRAAIDSGDFQGFRTPRAALSAPTSTGYYAN